MKQFVISDIHGHYDELMALYKQLPINPKKDQLVLLGDYVDRGPKTKQVVNQLIKWKKKYPHWQFLYGNHEDLMLDALMYNGRIYHSYDLWWGQGGKETYLSYLPKGLSPYDQAISQVKDHIPQEHLEFLAALPRWYETDEYYFVHGGLVPGEKPEDSDPNDLIWIRDQFILSNYDWGKKVIYGHTADGRTGSFEPNVMENKIGIDTAVCYSANNKLTALQLPEEIFFFELNHLRKGEI